MFCCSLLLKRTGSCPPASFALRLPFLAWHPPNLSRCAVLGCLQVTAMQIAGLKKLSKGTTLFIMDRNGGQSKAGAWGEAS